MPIKINKKLFNEKALEKGLTQEQIANQLGSTRSRLVTFLQGKHLTQIEFAKGICEILEIDINELITYKNDNNNNNNRIR